jgi:hypothetical protein
MDWRVESSCDFLSVEIADISISVRFETIADLSPSPGTIFDGAAIRLVAQERVSGRVAAHYKARDFRRLFQEMDATQIIRGNTSETNQFIVPKTDCLKRRFEGSNFDVGEIRNHSRTRREQPADSNALCKGAGRLAITSRSGVGDQRGVVSKIAES